MPRVKLICPEWRDLGLNSVSFFGLPPQGITQLAGLTPRPWDVEVVDENVQSIDYDDPVDLVGLTGMTCLAPGAYRIAGEYRRRGVHTVMGGIHASSLPDEAEAHVDTVVVGEADEIWPRVLDDYLHGTIKRRYVAALPQSLDFPMQRPVQRTHTVTFHRGVPFGLRFAYLQTSRGCPVNCEFCSVTEFNGKGIRAKSISYLLEEIRREKAAKADYFLFVDDNLVANKRWAKEFFRAITPLGIKWVTQTDIRIADEDVIDLAYASGLTGVFLGLETTSPETLKSDVAFAKSRWRRHYETGIRRLRQRGVVIEGSFIFGFDADDARTVRSTLDWAIDNGIDIAQLSILTPLPGTRLYHRLAAEGRITSSDWTEFNVFNCVFRPVNWTERELEQELAAAYSYFYSYRSILARARRLSPPLFAAWLLTNLGFRRFRLRDAEPANGSNRPKWRRFS